MATPPPAEPIARRSDVNASTAVTVAIVRDLAIIVALVVWIIETV